MYLLFANIIQIFGYSVTGTTTFLASISGNFQANVTNWITQLYFVHTNIHSSLVGSSAHRCSVSGPTTEINGKIFEERKNRVRLRSKVRRNNNNRCVCADWIWCIYISLCSKCTSSTPEISVFCTVENSTLCAPWIAKYIHTESIRPTTSTGNKTAEHQTKRAERQD